MSKKKTEKKTFKHTQYTRNKRFCHCVDGTCNERAAKINILSSGGNLWSVVCYYHYCIHERVFIKIIYYEHMFIHLKAYKEMWCHCWLTVLTIWNHLSPLFFYCYLFILTICGKPKMHRKGGNDSESESQSNWIHSQRCNFIWSRIINV